MSRIQELIKEKCPNGVEFKKIKDCCFFQNGYAFKSNLFKNTGDILLRITNINGKTIDLDDVKYIDVDDYNVNLEPFKVNYEDIVIAMSGATTGKIGMNKTNRVLYLNQRIGKIIPKNTKILNNHFLYHILLSKVNYFYNLAGGGAQPNLSSEAIKNTIIPVPPMEVQDEIARTLDRFEELEAELEVNLEAELEVRKQQYEFRREHLFNSNNIKSIEDICLNISSGGTPDTSHREYYCGNVPWLRTQEVNWNIIHDTELKITEEAIKDSSAKVIPKNCVIVAMYGATVGRVAINNIPLSTNQACCNLEINPRIADYKYVFYWLSSQYKHIKSLGQGSQTNINAQTVRKLKIPIPSIEEQQKIVKILDKFDKLVNDISEGLSVEVELRRKQYEYYRNKLLNFEELNNG